jgi:hypothetical protein
VLPWFEQLESRIVPTIFNPAQIQAAYGFNLISFVSGGKTYSEANKNLGSGQTIAIVDAYNDPNIASDLATFDSQWGLPAAHLTVAMPQGKPQTDSGWAMEISLDVEWAHAIAPGANILLVEAKTASTNNLLGAISYAASQPGVSVVSMSWGGSEFMGESSYDSYFTAHGVTYVASAGDSPGVIWPAVSSNVVAVGGTSLKLNGSSWSKESPWSDTGGGKSAYESEPSYQRSAQSTGKRTTPDLSYDADPNTGFYVYDSVPYGGQAGWWDVGGTSAGSPQISAMFAIADEGRALAGQGSLSSSQTLSALYSAPGSDYHTITGGSLTTTGRGSPIANLLVPYLVSYGTSAPAVLAPTVVGSPGPGGSGSSGSGPGSGGHRATSDFFVVFVGTENIQAATSDEIIATQVAAFPTGVFGGPSAHVPAFAATTHFAPLSQSLAGQSGGGGFSEAFFAELAVRPEAIIDPGVSGFKQLDLPENWNTPGKNLPNPDHTSSPFQAADYITVPGQMPSRTEVDSVKSLSIVTLERAEVPTPATEPEGRQSWLEHPVLQLLGAAALFEGWRRLDRDSSTQDVRRKPDDRSKSKN